jgi:hypothetical protein
MLQKRAQFEGYVRSSFLPRRHADKIGIGSKAIKGDEESLMNLACEQVLARLMLVASMFRDLPLTTSVCGQHAAVASSSGRSIQLCTFGRSIARCILLEHMTCNEIYVECNHGIVRGTNCFRKTTWLIDPITPPTFQGTVAWRAVLKLSIAMPTIINE